GGGASSGGGGGHHHPPAPIEWEDGMPTDNAASSSAEVHWLLRDGSGAENMDVRWRFTEGEPVKIRLVNPMSGAHPMQHPIHFHGQRFVVTAIDGKPVELRAWKDTVLVPGGSTIDIVLDPSNPGDWMAHCHIAEHLSTGMMIGFTVAPKAP
ncbi:MAG TPA: multicopper oxidase domain-containing protein, partial [Plasticicumulans sp.]|nr:multicopper oxidase domain-containing protein [Plasticicumulans sp.]